MLYEVITEVARILDVGEDGLSVADAQVFLDDDTLATDADADADNDLSDHRITSYNVCYTKLLRAE